MYGHFDTDTGKLVDPPIVILEQKLNKTISDQNKTINQLLQQVKILSEKVEKLSQQSS